MKHLLYFIVPTFLLIVSCQKSKSDNQNKPLTWSKVYGGTGYDVANSITTTADGGCIIAGYTTSNNGDVSSNHGGYDAWVVKLNASGKKVWSKVYGGTSDDQGLSILSTGDGGCIMAGVTLSSDGDFNGNHGANDAWVMKMTP